jgi:hypothetical protein
MGKNDLDPLRAGDETRTRDPQLGRLMLYQLSYARILWGSNFIHVGRAGFEPAKVYTNRFTVCPRWPLEYLPNMFKYFSHFSQEPAEGFEPPTR